MNVITTPYWVLGLRVVFQTKVNVMFLISTLFFLCAGKCHAQSFSSVKLGGNFLNIDKDNIIYKRGSIFEYDYYFIRDQDTLKSVRNNGIDSFIEKGGDKMEVDRLLFKVVKPPLFGRTNYRQSELTITYINPSNSTLATIHTGLVENKDNVWLHPPRFSLFRILELNPFPYIQFPAEINKEWKDSMVISDRWSDPLWKVWTGNVDINYDYKIVARNTINYRNEHVICWVIESQARSRLGKSTLISYFNEKYGFILLKYGNIDGSETVLSLR